jgi:hypothetical protein
MRNALILMTITLGWSTAAWVFAQPAHPGTTRALRSVRFAAVDIYVDSAGVQLAAYQIELTAAAGDVAIVGIEGGEHAAFADPPYYDPQALNDDRLIIAAFNTEDELPTGRNRVARVHVQITGPIEPEYNVALTVAAGADGVQIEAEVTIQPAASDEEE